MTIETNEQAQNRPCPIERCGWRDRSDAQAARIAELESRNEGLVAMNRECISERDAANARIAELEDLITAADSGIAAMQKSLTTANARADAAERLASSARRPST